MMRDSGTPRLRILTAKPSSLTRSRRVRQKRSADVAIRVIRIFGFRSRKIQCTERAEVHEQIVPSACVCVE